MMMVYKPVKNVYILVKLVQMHQYVPHVILLNLGPYQRVTVLACQIILRTEQH